MLPLAIWVMKGFYDNISWDVEMSALVDGASRIQTWYQVMLPQVMPGIASISIFSRSSTAGPSTSTSSRSSRTKLLDFGQLHQHYRGRLSLLGLRVAVGDRLVLHRAGASVLPFHPEVLDAGDHRRYQRGQLTVAEIRFKSLTKKFGSVVGRKRHRFGRFATANCWRSWAQRLRQDHILLMLAGIYKPTVGRHIFRRRTGQRRAAQRAQRRVGVSKLCALSPHDGV